MQDSLAESLRDFDRQIHRGPVDIYPQLMKITFAMVARSLLLDISASFQTSMRTTS